MGAICSRVLARLKQAQPPRTAGLRWIGVDETSYKEGHSLHDGHGRKVFDAFFEQISVKGREPIDLVSADGARWVDDAMKEWVAHALRCTDTFHIIQWATELLDELRRQSWRKAVQKAKAAPKGRRARPRKGEEASPERKAATSVKGPRDPLLQEPRELDRKAEGGASAHRDLAAAPPQGISAEGRDKACPEAAC